MDDRDLSLAVMGSSQDFNPLEMLSWAMFTEDIQFVMLQIVDFYFDELKPLQSPMVVFIQPKPRG